MKAIVSSQRQWLSSSS